jgi:nicotinamidase/pyrazinamidase
MSALILVDLQNDFMPGGALAVPDGDAVIPLANRVAASFELVVATQDWHPPGHGSFASQHPGAGPGDSIELDGLRQELWPDHCVQGTSGAELHADLDVRQITKFFQKGTDPRIDSYSTFFDNARRKSTGLADYLKEKDVGEVYLMGLATDYCVKFSVLDAVKLGFKTNMIEDGCRGINLKAGDVSRAIGEMESAGAVIVSSKALP